MCLNPKPLKLGLIPYQNKEPDRIANSKILGGGTASVNTKVADKAHTSHQEVRRLECEVQRRNVIHGTGKGEKGAR